METATASDLDVLSRFFHALADRKRLEILSRLTRGELCVCELTDAVRTKQSLLSFHLKTLREAGIVNNRRRGKWMYYSLNYESLEAINDMITTLAKRRGHNDACCCESLCCRDDPDNYARERRSG